MASPTYQESRRAFLQELKATAPYKHHYEVFRDFVTMSACSLHNALHKDEGREAEYLKIISGYQRDDQQRFPQLLAMLVTLLQHEPHDVLGDIYMELDIKNRDQGQFYTPSSVSDLIQEQDPRVAEYIERPYNSMAVTEIETRDVDGAKLAIVFSDPHY